MLDTLLCPSNLSDILEELLCLLAARPWRRGDSGHHRTRILLRHEFATGELHEDDHHDDTPEDDEPRGELVPCEEGDSTAVGGEDAMLVDGIKRRVEAVNKADLSPRVRSVRA